MRDFSNCNARLWDDKLGQISLATTTLFWGVFGNLRVIVFAWAAVALGYTTTQASTLVGVVAIGTAVGAVMASMRMRLDQATKVIPLGIAMGVLVIGLNFITNVWVAAPFLIMLGAIGGYLVVPMNALLQHRGAQPDGRRPLDRRAELQRAGLHPGPRRLLHRHDALRPVGLHRDQRVRRRWWPATMWLIRRWHASNCVHHRAELEHLLSIARQRQALNAARGRYHAGLNGPENAMADAATSIYDFEVTSIDGPAGASLDAARQGAADRQHREQVRLHAAVRGPRGALGGLRRQAAWSWSAFRATSSAARTRAANDEIASFCQLNYGVKFPMMPRSTSTATRPHPLWQWLTAEAPGMLGTKAIKWNFTKFLVGRDGQRASSATRPPTRPQSLKRRHRSRAGRRLKRRPCSSTSSRSPATRS